MSDLSDFGGFEFDPEKLKGLPAHRRKEVEAKIQRLKEGMDRNPLWKYVPHPRQALFHQTVGRRIRAFLAGNRAGKSHAGVADDLIQAVDRSSLPPWLQSYKRFEPPCNMRIVTPDLSNTGEGVVVEKLRMLAPKDQLLGGKWDKAYDQRKHRLWFENGSWIDFLSTEQELNKHGGQALHRVHFDEEPPGNRGKRIFHESIMRTVDYGGDLLFTMTPIRGMSWTYDVLTDHGEPRDEEEVVTITASIFDNPHLDKKSRNWALSQYSPEEREARAEGLFVALEGLVYPEFSLEHIVPQRDIERRPDGGQKWPVYVGIDPGLRYMAGVVYAWLDDQDQMEVFEELPIEGATVQEVSEAIHATNARLKVKPRWYVIDPAAQNRNHQTGRSDQALYAQHGIHAMPGQNSRRPGFDQIKERLGSTPPKMLVQANCETLISEFKTYRWRAEPSGEGVGREEPVKRDDHLLDALRYLCMSMPVKGRSDDPDEHLTPSQRAFRHSLTKIGNGRSRRHHLGGVYY